MSAMVSESSVAVMRYTAHVEEIVHEKVLDINLHGKLTSRDYKYLVPEIERLIRNRGKIRILVTMHEFDGWDLGALWEEIKWEWKHFADVERLAIVGEERWQTWMACFCKPFTAATVRHFKFDRLEQAYTWLEEP
ncbi:MAG TPA: STAS/SEC14 domain-containing protein [Chthoniobacteraceae bacterium]|jgi:hypothetical protein|nr:STAS/SEC14 domain-containing protein [Chthoniobacteraceae bacterium]